MQSKDETKLILSDNVAAGGYGDLRGRLVSSTAPGTLASDSMTQVCLKVTILSLTQ